MKSDKAYEYPRGLATGLSDLHEFCFSNMREAECQTSVVKEVNLRQIEIFLYIRLALKMRRKIGCSLVQDVALREGFLFFSG